MQAKHLLTMSLLVPLMAASPTAQAGSTISDRNYWPNQAKQSAPHRANLRPHVNSAFAYDRSAPAPPPAIVNGEGAGWRYHGGPKGR
ncbi:hypothetical protein [Bradyrhizobium sp.]|uniref:hypothetical protein n=1 Tax=Bradyrhizobium sp. TaxID=376 RepID=UPI00262BF534|nr:hypothetical protein [Bradyrhizobium sp.]